MSDTTNTNTDKTMTTDKTTKKTRVIIGLPGKTFSQTFLLTWSQSLYSLWACGQYDIVISPSNNSFSLSDRMHTLGLDVRRGKNQKPFDNGQYDVFVSIDSDIVFSTNQLVELIECTKTHPVVSGYYKMPNNKQYSVIKEWNKQFFAENGTFPFLELTDLDKYTTAFAKELEEYNKLDVKDRGALSTPEFMKVSYTGMGFFACRKEVLDNLQYPYFYGEMQRYRAKDGTELVNMCNEEVAFCKNLEEAGYDIMLNTRLLVGHEQRVIL